ncbi:dTDP-4-dehydrorhamnose reductase [Comamonas testosteroni]|uniref:dTDP-4-dehydrorhamnose reductase n=1 Tax=Comamonas testosteroni TaxID=285 RepID=A0A373FPD8_COMTE|nr:dTDP-4-dehydrorhamnose reductase [Comamonas testosteroni]RGE46034.1 dTDP-4-dehydrorhamnose reductase [Comamonas testosteroni]
MKLLLLGKNGQVGWELQRSLAPLGELVALDRSMPGGDVSDLAELANVIRRERPDVIVNASAHTAVDKAESEQNLALRLNAEAPEVMALEAKRLGTLLVHYSTDYVFDGSGDVARKEGDPTGPLSVYGASKLDGERCIIASGCRHLIFRTSWVYAARGGNFAKTMLRLAQEREKLSVINDQWGTPTGADLIADVTAHAIRHVADRNEALGLYHLVASGETTWHAYASHVIATAKQLRPDLDWKALEIAAVPTSAYPTPAIRPLNSRLDTQKLQSTMQLRLPQWQQGVDRMLREIL